MASKYLGKQIDYRWKVVGTKQKKEHTYYVLKNIYNEQEIEIIESVFTNIIKEKTTIDKVIATRIRRDKTMKRKNIYF